MKENIFPELSGMELHYSSVNGLAIHKPFGIFDDYIPRPTTGGSDNPFVAPGAAESLGASGGNIIAQQNAAFAKMQIDFERHLIFGKHEVSIGVDPYDAKRPYDYVEISEREIALKFLEDIKKMPHCILVDVLIDSDEMYAVDVHGILLVRGDGLTHAQQEFVVEKIKEHCIAKLSVPY